MIAFIDVSSYLYAGMTTSFGEKASYRGIPTGGAYLLLQKLAQCIKEGDTAVLLFDSSTNAREILPEYKGSRTRNPKIRFQGDLLYEYLRYAVPNCFKVNGYEADWLAFNSAENARSKFNKCGLTFRTVDYDWCHNIVTKYDTMTPATKGYMAIYYDNFEDAFSQVGVRVPLNSISAYKVFFGDASDNIKPYKGCRSNEDLMNIYIAYCAQQKLDPRQLDSMMDYINRWTVNLGDNYEQLINRARVIFPREMPDRSCLEIDFNPVDKKKLQKILSLTGCKSIANRLGVDFIEDMGQLQVDLLQKYKTEYLVERTNLFETAPKKSFDIEDRGGFILK